MNKFHIVGGGTFGLSTILALLEQGIPDSDIFLYDRLDIPAQDASSTDINKIVRPDYGTDLLYSKLALESIQIFKEWNKEKLLFHSTGVLFSTSYNGKDGFEYQSFQKMKQLDVDVKLATPLVGLETLQEKMPFGYINMDAGWANSRETIDFMFQKIKKTKVNINLGQNGKVTRILPNGLQVNGEIRTGMVILAAGAWSLSLFPELESVINITGQPVIHFIPKDIVTPQSVWVADISKLGFYGFPISEGKIKIAHHGDGYTSNFPKTSENGWNMIPLEAVIRFREFLQIHFPHLNNLDIDSTRLCWYTDTFDGHFLISKHPSNPNIVFATGGCGHAFKFAPIIGRIVLDVIFDRNTLETARFAWRTNPSGSSIREQARSAAIKSQTLEQVTIATPEHLTAAWWKTFKSKI